ncbi:MAG: Asp-tRNA(Asn)/Glu-tRNA(Gln) amidotransferase subunit GatB [Patescibacteria group bacterium]|jgi:aspartyl-tRNA(Asn)/glutamyl-tRNA(Gln) amidotransferase subunit B|nr:Asp-tRNA(Asn)/Glu-tRNA(Gln) amidotransferase subunit GatB [Patescibacteria group bacterium]MDD5172885.1 Asp-tRNA(Asn)/Glu-tRNA(Gln) amidotransferase subunit GatB [Patescibacteria group bacterium]
MLNLESIIGLEVHLELNTKSKFFCACSNKEADEPNVNVCPVCLGHPGVLPTLNKEAVIKALKLGLALNGKINENSFFERKNYFYPDLPKGYQISQYQLPLVSGGRVQTEEGIINLERIHLEEDTAKIFHFNDLSLLDFNRAGVPLVEIVTRPEIKSPNQAKVFLEELQRIVRCLGISDADMEKGQLRCDSNISLRPKGDKNFYPKIEIKNLNSFRAVENALNYEIKQQKESWNKNNPPKHQITKGWDENRELTFKQRSKEEENDYRYFPEPDLPLIDVNFFKEQGIDIDFLKNNLPELPFQKRKYFMEECGFDAGQAKILAQTEPTGVYSKRVIFKLNEFLKEIGCSKKEISAKTKKLINKWLINQLLVLQKNSPEKEFQITPEDFSEFLNKILERKIPDYAGQEILKKIFETGKNVEEIISEYNFKTTENKDELKKIVQEVINNNPEIVKKINQGKTNIIQYLIGQIMKKTRGQVEPKLVQEILERELKK